MMGRRSWALVLASASLIACSSTDSNGPSSQDAGAVVPDGGGPVTQTVGASGGTVIAKGVSLTIPAGALVSDVEISIAPGGAVPAGYTALSAFYTFTPVDTVFLKPVTVTLTLTSAGANPTVFWSNTAGGYDALATSASAASASASVTHCGSGFVGEGAGQTGSDAGGDATMGDDASPASDAGTVADSGAPGDSAAGDTGAPSDAGVPVESGTAEAGIVDAATVDSATTDAGFLGIKATIDSVVTTFTANQSVVDQNGIYVISADDSASSTHWTLSLSVSSVPQEVCTASMPDPVVVYTHFTSGVADGTYSTLGTNSSCSFVVQGTATTVGAQAHGVFSATVSLAPDAGVGTHTLVAGTYDVIR
jgi:hypothetical protein